MTKAFTISTARANAALDTLAAAHNTGYLRVYGGTVPADANAALGGATLLGTLTFGATAFPAASSGAITANAITRDNSADATGTATFFRTFASDGTTVLSQGNAGDSGDAPVDLQLVSKSIITGQPIEVTSLVVSM